MKKIIVAILLISLLFPATKVNAITSDKFSQQNQGDYFYVRTTVDGEYTYALMQTIRRVSDDHNAYGIEPQKTIYEGLTTTPVESDFLNNINMSEETWERVQLLTYYGHNCYLNHGSIMWYFATQLLIYNAIDPAGERVFVNKTTKEINHSFDEMINVITGLVDDSLKVPNFDLSNDIHVLEKQTLIDKNNVLDNFDLIFDEEVINVEINNDELIITPLTDGKIEIEFIKKNTTYNNMLLYNYGAYQSLIIPLGHYPIIGKVKLNILPAKTIEKETEQNNDFSDNDVIIDSNKKIEIIDENIKNVNLEDKDIFITLPNTSE